MNTYKHMNMYKYINIVYIMYGSSISIFTFPFHISTSFPQFLFSCQTRLRYIFREYNFLTNLGWAHFVRFSTILTQFLQWDKLAFVKLKSRTLISQSVLCVFDDNRATDNWRTRTMNYFNNCCSRRLNLPDGSSSRKFLVIYVLSK